MTKENWEIVGVIVVILGAVSSAIFSAINFFQNKGYQKRLKEETDEKIKTLETSSKELNKDLVDLKNCTRSMKCEEHHDEIVTIKTVFMTLNPGNSAAFGVKNSPTKLSPDGQKIFDAVHGDIFLESHKERLFDLIDKLHPKTALDVENLANVACLTFSNDDSFNYIKDYIYNLPSIKITQEGKEIDYDLKLDDVCFILSIPLRDKYLTAKKALRSNETE